MLAVAALLAGAAAAAPEAPAATPHGLSLPSVHAVPAADGRVTITWRARSDGGVTFRLYRSRGPGGYELIAETPAGRGVVELRVPDLVEPFETVSYRLFVVSEGGEFELGELIRIDPTCGDGGTVPPAPRTAAAAVVSWPTYDRPRSAAPHRHPRWRHAAGYRSRPDPPVPRSLSRG